MFIQLPVSQAREAAIADGVYENLQLDARGLNLFPSPFPPSAGAASRFRSILDSSIENPLAISGPRRNPRTFLISWSVERRG